MKKVSRASQLAYFFQKEGKRGRKAIHTSLPCSFLDPMARRREGGGADLSSQEPHLEGRDPAHSQQLSEGKE